MSSSGTSITCEVGLQLIVPDRAPVPLVARLDYSVDDPYAIRAAFHVGDDEPVEWIFARELLTVGIIRETGEGDVRIWPSQDGKERMVNIALSSPFGQARFHAQVAPLSSSCTAPTSWFLPGRRATTSTSTLKSLSTSARPRWRAPVWAPRPLARPMTGDIRKVPDRGLPLPPTH